MRESKFAVTIHFVNGEEWKFRVDSERAITVTDYYVTITHVVKLETGKEGIVQNMIPWSAIRLMHKQWERDTLSPTVRR